MNGKGDLFMPYVLIDKNKISKLDIINTKGITASEIKRIYNPDTFINLALYDILFYNLRQNYLYYILIFNNVISF